MKQILLILAIFTAVAANSQVTRVTLQASGLTCSMCSNAINKALRSLDFVSEVNADLKTYYFEITFKPNSHIDFDLIRKKVESAGFSVSAFYVTVLFNNTAVKTGDKITFPEQTLVFVETRNQVLSGANRIRIIDKGFVSSKEYKHSQFSAQTPQTYHVTL